MGHEVNRPGDEPSLAENSSRQPSDESRRIGQSDTGITGVRCPNCGERVPLNDLSSDGIVRCPHCRSDFNLQTDVATLSLREAPKLMAHFRLVEYLGAGQYGNVWKALDTRLDRIVALKIPRAPLAQPGDAEKFLREARAAAQLSHRNIVPVFEVGRHEDVVYIASDFVQGADLKRWLTIRRLTLSEAAELCALLAEALHHAHLQGVVHRDLKPANIMMDLDGQPHIMDFGMAKRDQGEITITMDGQVLGTPAYMSPEQARGESHRVDGRSDIYSLGVILYQLITGELPFRGDKQMLMVHILTDEPPSPRSLNARIPRDLETICLKCLQKSPDRRYASGSELAADLRRWLNKEPIIARPVGRWERGTRWCQRHPAVASLLFLIVFITALGFALVTWQWRHARAQYLAAERQRQRGDRYHGKLVEVVDKMLFDVGAHRLKEEPNSAPVRRALIDEALQYYDWLSQQEASDEAMQLRMAHALTSAGKLRGWLGENQLAEQSFQKAARFVESLSLPTRSSREARELAAEIAFQRGAVLVHSGKDQESLAYYDRAIQLAREARKQDPQWTPYDIQLAAALSDKGRLLEQNSEPDGADACFAEAIQTLQAVDLDRLEPETRSELQRILATVFHNRANLLKDSPRYRESSSMFQQAVQLYEQDSGSGHEQRDGLASALGDWSIYLHYIEQFEQAQKTLDRAITMRTQLAKDHPQVPEYQFSLALLQQNAAFALQAKRLDEQACTTYRAALDAFEQLVHDFPDVPRYQEVLGGTWNLYSAPLSATGQDEQAAAALQTAESVFSRLLQADANNASLHHSLAGILDNQAKIRIFANDYEHAETLLQQAIDHEQRALEQDPRHTGFLDQMNTHLYNLAIVKSRQQKHAEAINTYQQVIEMLRRRQEVGPERIELQAQIGGTLNNMAMAAMRQGDYAQAETWIREAIEVQEAARKKRPDHLTVLSFLTRHWGQLATIHDHEGRRRELLAAYENGIAVAEQYFTQAQDQDSRTQLVVLLADYARKLADPPVGEDQDLARAESLVKRASELDPDQDYCVLVQGIIARFREDWDGVLAAHQNLVDDERMSDIDQAQLLACLTRAYSAKHDAVRAKEMQKKLQSIADSIDDPRHNEWLQKELDELRQLIGMEPL